MRPNFGLKGTLAVAGAIMLTAGWGFSAETNKQTHDQIVVAACQTLTTCKLFAFGGVGYAGTISDGEKAFHTVAASTNAVELFRALLKQGTVEGKMYGLCGIRRLAPQSFKTEAEPVRTEKEVVATMSGCERADERTAEVITRIRSGSYDLYFAK